jgi:hypothetical protein
MAGIIEVKDQGKVRIYDADNSNYVDIVVPSTVSSNRTITLPDASFTVPTADTVGGITEADQWRITADHSGVGVLTANWERVDSFGGGYLGTGMTQSSGIFTFPSTGIWHINFTATAKTSGGASSYMSADIDTTTNNSSYNSASLSFASFYTTAYNNISINFMFDVTSVSTHKVRFNLAQNQASTPLFGGSTTQNRTAATFIRLGNT